MYDINVKTIDGKEISLSQYKGQVVVIIDTAAGDGAFSPQLVELDELYKKYKDKGFAILAFPCNQFINQEPGTDEEIKATYAAKYDTSFPLFSKIEVNGKNRHPLFRWLTRDFELGDKYLEWNFVKFIVDKEGNSMGPYGPSFSAKQLEPVIIELLNK
jgi:glutathione peroxidase